MVEKHIQNEFENVFGAVNKHTFYLKLIKVLKRLPPSDFLEFGTRIGITSRKIAKGLHHDKKLYTFDWFKGLPEQWHEKAPIGHFSCNKPSFGTLPIEIVDGLFQETLVPFVNKHKDKVYFIHLDADLYSSTKYVLENVWPLVTTKTLILFDEYAVNDYMLQHEYRAWKEFVQERNVQWRYVFHHKYKRVLVEVL